MKKTTKAIIKSIEDNFSSLDSVVVVDNKNAYECVETDNIDSMTIEEIQNGLYQFKREWNEIEWRGDRPLSHEVAIVIHDATDNIIDYCSYYRDNPKSWESFDKQTGYFSEPHNSCVMGIYED